MSRSERIAGWLRDQATAANARGFILGMSGGVDSAIVARLCQMAMPDRVLGVIMPCHSHPEDEADAMLAAEASKLPVVRVDLSAAYDALALDITAATSAERGHGFRPDAARTKLALANVKPRLRMTTLYTIGMSLGFLVTGTGNRSEIAIGYYTKYGDGGVDLLPIGALVKSEVRALARELGVPARIIDKPPSAGLWAGQTDESEMGFTYEDLEKYLDTGPESVAPETAARILHLMNTSAHKRELPPVAPK
ncbi:MAG TPA: NAD(+) synthase [Vicinamibacterales bacterium]|nr:NAD(+) synthase [Vicinamibacterales bacterium]